MSSKRSEEAVEKSRRSASSRKMVGLHDIINRSLSVDRDDDAVFYPGMRLRYRVDAGRAEGTVVRWKRQRVWLKESVHRCREGKCW